MRIKILVGLALAFVVGCGQVDAPPVPASAPSHSRSIESDPDFAGYWSTDGKPVPILKTRKNMATLTVRPNADAANPHTGGSSAFTPNSGGNLWSRVDDTATQPTVPDTSDYISGTHDATNDIPADCRLTLDTSALSAGDTITGVTVWIYSTNSAGVPAPGTYVGLFSGGSELAGGVQFAGTSTAWHSNTYSGLSLAGNTALSVYLQAQGDPTAVPTPIDNTSTVYAVYAVITYTAGGGGGGGSGHVPGGFITALGGLIP